MPTLVSVDLNPHDGGATVALLEVGNNEVIFEGDFGLVQDKSFLVYEELPGGKRRLICKVGSHFSANEPRLVDAVRSIVANTRW